MFTKNSHLNWGEQMAGTGDRSNDRREDRLDELFERWEKLYKQGRDVSAEELCRDCPSLKKDLAQLIAASKHVACPNAEPETNNLRMKEPDGGSAIKTRATKKTRALPK